MKNLIVLPIQGIFDLDQGRLVGVSAKGSPDVTFLSGVDSIDDIGSAGGLASIPFSSVIPLSGQFEMEPKTVSGPLPLTIGANPKAGGQCSCTFISDGVNVPTLSGALALANDFTYDNSGSGLRNFLDVVWRSGSAWYAWSQPAVNTPVASDVTAPTVPAGLATSSNTATSVGLTWSASTDAVGVTGYKILRGGVQIGTSATTSYTDGTVSASTSYSYTVQAYDAAGNTSASSSALAVTTPASTDVTAPTVPTGLTVGTTTASTAPLSWNASTDAVGVTGYKIYRDGSQVGTSATTSYTDTGLTASTAYTYNVAAYDAAGNTSAQTAGVVGTTAAAAAGPQPLRYTVLSGLTEAVDTPTTGHYTYTANAGATGYGTLGMGVSNLSCPAATDGYVQLSVTAGMVASGMPAWGVKESATKPAASIFSSWMGQVLINTTSHVYTYSIGNATTVNTAVTPAAGDTLQIIRVGSTVKIQYSRAATPTTFVDIIPLSAASAGVLWSMMDASATGRIASDPIASAAWQ